MRVMSLTKSRYFLSGVHALTRVFFVGCLATALNVSGEVASRAPSPSSNISRGSLRATVQPELDRSQPVRASGIIEKFGAEENQTVEAGALLVQLNADMERAEVARAEAGVEIATNEVARTKADLSRIETLHNDPLSIGSKKDLQDAQFAHNLALGRKKEAEANLAMARTRLNERATYATFAGTVVRRFRGIGEAVEKHELIARVMDASKLHIEVYATADLLGKFTQGQIANILVEEGTAKGTIIPATVTSIDHYMLPESGTFRIKLQVEPSDKVRVGTPVILQLPSEVH